MSQPLRPPRSAGAATRRVTSGTELGRFLRTRREAVTPTEVGLPVGPRRRTPGLRRAEVATLAGVSVEYLTRLEQGRDRHPSMQVLGALADALRMSAEQRDLLRSLLKASTGGAGGCLAAPAQDTEVRPTIRSLLEQLDPAPAVVLTALNDLLAYTTGFQRLAEPLGMLTEPANLLRYVFTDPRARNAFPEWDRVADAQVAQLRTRTFYGDTRATGLADSLSVEAGPAFTVRFRAPAQPPSPTGRERWWHPDVGELDLSYETLSVADTGQQRLLVYLPADQDSRTALEKLTS